MAITNIALTNPGAEAGSTAGWTAEAGTTGFTTSATANGLAPYAGAQVFQSGTSHVAAFGQTVAVPPALEAAVDARTAGIRLTAYHNVDADGSNGKLFVEFYAADGVTLVGEYDDLILESTATDAWVQRTLEAFVPPSTRFIKIGAYSEKLLDFSVNRSYWDDFVLDISDDYLTDYPTVAEAYQLGSYAIAASDAAEGDYTLHAHQVAVYSIANAPSEEAYSLQLAGVILAGGDAAEGDHPVHAHQFGAYALVMSFPDRRDLRAWTLTQDDHDFYILHVGPDGTIVYDKLTEQWCSWWSPGYRYWRGADGCEWAGMNVACDQRSGKVWEVDPTIRADYGTTPITSKITGMVPARLRQAIPVYAGELVVSQGQPSEALEGEEVGINLRFTDDGMVSWVDMGRVVGEPYGEFTIFRWYGLGQFGAPGRIFEIVDTGYARRIDSFDISIGGEGE